MFLQSLNDEIRTTSLQAKVRQTKKRKRSNTTKDINPDNKDTLRATELKDKRDRVLNREIKQSLLLFSESDVKQYNPTIKKIFVSLFVNIYLIISQFPNLSPELFPSPASQYTRLYIPQSPELQLLLSQQSLFTITQRATTLLTSSRS